MQGWIPTELLCIQIVSGRAGSVTTCLQVG